MPRSAVLSSNGMGILPGSSLVTKIDGIATAQKRQPSSPFLVSLKQTSDADQQDPMAAAARKRRLAAGMAFLTGMADIIFLFEFQTFSTMLTGNSLRLCIAMVESKLALTLYFCSVFASYLAGIASVRLMRKKPSKTILWTAGAAVSALFIGADLLYYLPSTATAAAAVTRNWIPVSMLAAGFGLVNAVGTDFAGTLTFVVTGHLTKLTHLFTDCYVERKTLSGLDRAFAKQSLSVVGGFFGGGLVASFLHARHLLIQKGTISALGVLYVSYEGQRIKRWWRRRNFREMSVVEVFVNDEIINEGEGLVTKGNATIPMSDTYIPK